MRRVFTCLTSGRQRVLSSMAESVFLADPDCPTLVDGNKQNSNKILAQRARGSREHSFFSFFFIYFIKLIKLIEFNFVLTFLRDARERGAHDTARVHCQVRSGPVSRPNRAPVRLCDPYVLARPRTTSTEAPRSPSLSMLVPSQ